MRRTGQAGDKPPLRLGPAGAAKIVVDGKLDDWGLGPSAPAATIDPGGGRKARAAMAYDQANLYVAFDVTDDSPMRNASADYALLFKTGDCCEVLLGTDPKAPPQRRQVAAGDIRLLFSVMRDQPVAVLYEPILRGDGKRQPRIFSSPTGVEPFDRVEVLADAKVAVERTAAGYRLEASVPLSAIGFAPRPGEFIRGDLGVIYSDAGGSRNALRACYANTHTAIVNDVPTESRLEPQYWGSVQVDK
jgi:hypothetical protein